MNELLYEDEDHVIFWDSEKKWFYVREGNCEPTPVMLVRSGFFELTQEEFSAVKDFIIKAV